MKEMSDFTPPLLTSNIHSFPTASSSSEVQSTDPSDIAYSIPHTPSCIEHEAKDYVSVMELRNEGALLSTEEYVVDPVDVIVSDESSKSLEEELDHGPGSLKKSLRIDQDALKKTFEVTKDSSNQFNIIQHTPLYTPHQEDEDEGAGHHKKGDTIYELKKAHTDVGEDYNQSLEDLIDSQIASMSKLSSSLKESISTKRPNHRSPVRSRSRQPVTSPTNSYFNINKDDEHVQNKIFESPNLLNRGGSYSGVSEYRHGGTSSHSLYDNSTPTEFRVGRSAHRGSEHREGQIKEEDGTVEEDDPIQRMRSGSREYLRSISRTRSSVSSVRGSSGIANGGDLIIDEVELESEGVLINDPEFNLELETAQNAAIERKEKEDLDLIGKLEREIGLFEVRGGTINDGKNNKTKTKGKNKKKKAKKSSNREEPQINSNETTLPIITNTVTHEEKPIDDDDSLEETMEEKFSTPSVVESTEETPKKFITEMTVEEPLDEEQAKVSIPLTTEEEIDDTTKVIQTEEEPEIEEPLVEELSNECQPLAVEQTDSLNPKDKLSREPTDEFIVEEPVVEEQSSNESVSTPLKPSTISVEETEESSIHSKDDTPEVEEPQYGEVEELPEGEVEIEEEGATNSSSISTQLKEPVLSTTSAKRGEGTIHDDTERLIMELEADLGGEVSPDSSIVDSENVKTSPLGNSKEIKIEEKISKPTEEPVVSTIKEESKEESEDLDHIPTQEEIIAHLKDEPIYIYTSLAGGGFHMPQRTNRLVTILQANRIPFKYRDLGTDEQARNVWRRYSGGKSLPGIVRGEDDIIGNWEKIEELNEDYQVRVAIYETL